VLRRRIKEMAQTRVRYGYRRIHVLLRREGWKVNPKRVARLYREEGLSLRARPETSSSICRTTRSHRRDATEPRLVHGLHA
jgi:putative transposase